MAKKAPPSTPKKKSKGFLDLFMDEFREVVLPVPDFIVDDLTKKKKKGKADEKKNKKK